jgi:hypothetical protein
MGGALMFDTVNTKATHYTDGCFRTGSGEHVIILLGSCRIMPYVNYFARLNTDDRFTICVIYVVNFTTDANDNPTDCEAQIDRLQYNPVFMDMVKRCKWFIHEHVENYGFLNTSKDLPKSMFRLGIQPEIDICIPNFNDVFVLENDWVDCGMPTPEDYVTKGEQAVDGFCDVCQKSSFPEMGDYFRESWRSIRFFWRPNHISAPFSMYIFRRMNSRFLHLKLTDEFIEAAKQEDLFKTPCTQPTQRDREAYRLQW